MWQGSNNNSMKMLRKVKKNAKSLRKITNFKELSIKRVGKSPKGPQIHFKTIQMRESVLSGQATMPD